MINLPSNPNGRKIGVFGGSFNPAHQGHIQLTLHALKALDLDEVWWLISPQNPLKSSSKTQKLSQRLAQAKQQLNHPKVKFSILESKLANNQTSKTVNFLRKRAPNAHFVWLMGADNLNNISKWHNWHHIFQSMPVAIFDRNQNSMATLNAQAAIYYKSSRIPANQSQLLPQLQSPAWCYIHMKSVNISSTQIRRTQLT